ncbi:MAG: hypothetical protein WBB45_07750 [Cyclobacteriaceae bacterium]
MTFAQYEEQFALDLTGTGSGATRDVSTLTTLDNLLIALINAIPYYGDPKMDSDHRGALANLLEIHLPNEKIAPHPIMQGPWYGYYFSSYSYSGSYTGYLDAFYHGIGPSAASNQVATRVAAVNAGINAAWWGDFGVAVLTDAIRQKVSVSLDTGSLKNELDSRNNTLKPAVTASYLAVFEAGFQPTASALNAIKNSSDASSAASTLDHWIANGRFTANINQSLAVGGDSAIAATWFLYNLWVSLTALGLSDVNSAINTYKTNGLHVPDEVGATNWWNGSFLSWYHALSGTDVMPQASGAISSTMPETISTVFTGSTFPVTTHENTQDGYSHSLAEWGSLARFKPQPSSCFGADTMVLMADDTQKAISEVQTGDMVKTSAGDRKVVLVESPYRAGRSLYRINDLKATITIGHPLRTADEARGKYAALDPWNLIDGIPTITKDGVTAVAEGLSLSVLSGGNAATLTVQSIKTEVADAANTEEKVYDLLLESWAKDRPAYYVGGPDTFLATEAETVDPLYDVFITVTIVTALEMAVPLCREFLGNPAVEVPSLVKAIDIDKAMSMARQGTRAYTGGRSLPRPSIPAPDFYQHKGQWDGFASLLEYYLVLNYGRKVLSEIYHGWSTGHFAHSHEGGDRLVANLHDIELIGDPIPAGQKPEIKLSLSGLFSIPRQEHSLTLDSTERPAWNLRIDELMDMGRLPETDSGSFLHGEITAGDTFKRKFRVFLTQDRNACACGDHFLSDEEGNITGRIYLGVRRMTTGDIAAENTARQGWDNHAMMAYAYSIGRQMGYQLMSLTEAASSVKETEA